jgi:hypothetical protein
MEENKKSIFNGELEKPSRQQHKKIDAKSRKIFY